MAKIRNQLGRNFKTERKGDTLTIEKRSALMSKIKSKETNFELRFFQSLKDNRIKFESHPKDILGHPDLVIRKKKTCVFLDSDFWHGWQYPRWKHKLKNDFWREKIERNRKRDQFVNFKLRKSGWHVIRLWEHDLKRKDPIGFISLFKS